MITYILIYDQVTNILHYIFIFLKHILTKNHMQIFIGVNKNRRVSLHTVEPVRCMETGTWVSSRPYVNSIVQKNIDDMISHSKMTWEMEPEVIEIDLKRIYED